MIAWAIGCPGSGKTTLARSLALKLARSSGKALLAVDCEGDERMRELPRAASVDALPALMSEHRAVCFDAMTCGRREPKALARYVETVGNLVVLVDGAHVLLDARSAAGDAWVRVQRVHRHAGLDLLWTTHHLGGDVPQVVQACAPDLYVFRTTAPSALRVLESHYGCDPDKIRNLGRGNFLRVRVGFGLSG